MFTIDDRRRVHRFVLKMASADKRVIAGALVGSLVEGGDRWSDIDLTFGVIDSEPVANVLTDWTRQLSSQLDAVDLFDARAGDTLYRVFILPGCLQLDISFTPASRFGPIGSKYKMMFGKGKAKPAAKPTAADELFGEAVHHALRARFSIERKRYWQAEYWISALRDAAISLACRRRGLPARYGRGFDDLPADILKRFRAALVRTLDREELLRALSSAIKMLLAEGTEAEDLLAKTEAQLRELGRGPARPRLRGERITRRFGDGWTMPMRQARARLGGP